MEGTISTTGPMRNPHIRHIGGGEIHLYDGDNFVREFGVFVGDFRDRDKVIGAVNEDYHMRWKAKEKPAWVRRFAWLPMRFDDEWIWLEHYEWQHCGDYVAVRLVDE